MFRLTSKISILLTASGLFLSGCFFYISKPAPQAAVSKKDLKILTIGTADSGGTMYPVGKAIARVLEEADGNIKVNISASKGSVSNAKDLEKGNIDLGLVSGDIAFAAVDGKNEFKDSPAENLRAIGAVYPSLSNWMALTDSGISYVHELRGKRIGIGPQDSTTELSARAVLSSMLINEKNSDLENCGLGSGAEKVKKKTLDAIHGFTGIPITGLAELAESTPCSLLKYTDSELQSMIRSNSFYYKDVIPAGTYKGQEEDIPTFGIKCLLCVNADMDEELVYELTSILYEHADDMKNIHSALTAVSRDGFMYSELPIKLHPGAERFYMEKGLLTQN